MAFPSALLKQVRINGILISASKTSVYQSKVEIVSRPGDNQSGDGVAEERKAHSDGEI
jgi:hypothetical protein